tara:strand:+ start:225 stop:581 length:357 start_codon:yes stop_codon:yes gene_type:complete
VSEWVQGDGGPVILLQEGAIPLWRGAADFERSLLEGGDLETDYDVICEAPELSAIRHHERDMLVLSDCSWHARLFALPGGEVGVLQIYGQQELSVEPGLRRCQICFSQEGALALIRAT